MLENREPGSHVFASSQALLDHATHRLLWSWYRRDRDSQPGEPTIREAADPEAADSDFENRSDHDSDPRHEFGEPTG
jgi:hypothetical protein